MKKERVYKVVLRNVTEGFSGDFLLQSRKVKAKNFNEALRILEKEYDDIGAFVVHRWEIV